MEPALVVIGLSHRTATIEVRERFWMSPERQREALSVLRNGEGINEAFVFSTCNRTEFVVWGDPTLAENSILRFLASRYDLRLCEWKNFYRLLDDQALAHAFRVSCGLDSMHLGEGQIGREVNAAWQQARSLGCTGPFLDTVLKKALAVRRQLRRQTSKALYSGSAPQVAVDLAGTIFGSLGNRTVVILGAGAMGSAAAQALCRQGVHSLTVAGPTDARAQELSRKLGTQSVPFSDRYRTLAAADFILSATSAPGYVITGDELPRAVGDSSGRKRVIVDLALPRDVDPRVRQLQGTLLYDLDDLERYARTREAVIEPQEAEGIVLAAVQDFPRERKAADRELELSVLHQRLDEICRQELESFRQEKGPFPQDQDQLLASVSARITHRIAGSLRGKDLRLPAPLSRS